jgi:beta-glucosidase
VDQLPYFTDWPKITPDVPPDPSIEVKVASILEQMTLEEKIGQMIQPEMQQLTPEEAGRYKFGSALNGAGVWPDRDKFTSAKQWAGVVDEYWSAVDDAYKGRPFRIPFMWACDAVHGHNNLYGATVFPHNIGLGATRDPDLIESIGRITAKEIAASGMDWTFAPTVAVPTDRRWGRYFEGYGENPEIAYAYAGRMVRGLQNVVGSNQADQQVVASIKHWVGDGGTINGIDRGTANCSELELLNHHAMGYISALRAGAMVVMTSFSSWDHPLNYDHCPDEGAPYNYKMHGSRYLINDVLKNKMGFQGVIITDWDGHAEVSKCTLGDARYVFNAGVDILMVEARQDWMSVYRNTVEDVGSGKISLNRIDDAVRRILRMKFHAHLWDKPRPIERSLVVKENATEWLKHREVARDAVRKSLVLLKNDNKVLPLARTSKVLLTGSGVDNIQKQTGGWSLSWQSTEITLDDFPHASTIAMATRSIVGEQNCVCDPLLERASIADFDVAIVAIGEDAYAEMKGDIRPWRTLEYAALKPSYEKDLSIIKRLKKERITIVTILLSGRPLYVNEEINLSDAFIAAWLPGTEGNGITDLLFRADDGKVSHDFQGKLPVNWPTQKHSFTVATSLRSEKFGRTTDDPPILDKDSSSVFTYGYGLNYSQSIDSTVHRTIHLHLDRNDPLPSAEPEFQPLQIFGEGAKDNLALRVAGNGLWVGGDVSRTEPTDVLLGNLHPISYAGENDGIAVSFNGRIASLYVQDCEQRTKDMRGYIEAGAELVFEIKMVSHPKSNVLLACHDGYPSQGAVDITERLLNLPLGVWSSIDVPLLKLAEAGSEFQHINTFFMLYTEGSIAFDLGRVSWLINAS